MLQEFKKIDEFYPTPEHLIEKMFEKLDFKKVKFILEPSAGKGDIVEKLNYKDRYFKVNTIEKNVELQSILRGEGYKVIDNDFLTYRGGEMYDLIIANPPFSEGEHHLLKAIDIMYNGQIIFLLNAETIKNPCTKYRQLLIEKLNKLNAEIEYIENGFIDSERKTNVEVALIYINIERELANDLFKDLKETKDFIDSLKDEFEVTRKDDIHNLVQDYNRTIESGINILKIYYQNSPFLYKFIRLNSSSNSRYSSFSWEDIKKDYKRKLNDFYKEVRVYYWEKALDIPEIKNHLTSRKESEFRDKLRDYSYMEFTESNIRQFILNIIGNYEKNIKESITDLFEQITREYHWTPETETNKLHFTSWKTNNAYKVNKKFIIPFYPDAFSSVDYSTDKRYWHLGIHYQLDDIDKVMNYLDGLNPKYLSIREVLKDALYRQQNRKIKSTYFEISVFKKGTIHLTILDEGILRRFNLEACKDKNWLPHNYSTKPYKDLSEEEKNIVELFEGKESYVKNWNNTGIEKKG